VRFFLLPCKVLILTKANRLHRFFSILSWPPWPYGRLSISADAMVDQVANLYRHSCEKESFITSLYRSQIWYAVRYSWSAKFTDTITDKRNFLPAVRIYEDRFSLRNLWLHFQTASSYFCDQHTAECDVESCPCLSSGSSRLFDVRIQSQWSFV